MLHLCGPQIRFELASALDARAVSWSVHEPGNPSLEQGRARSGRAVVGGLDHAGTLVKGTPEAPEENLRAITGRRDLGQPDERSRPVYPFSDEFGA